MKILEKNIINVYGQRGREWLHSLPSRVHMLKEEWGLSDLKAFDNLTHNYVLSGSYKSIPIVLKISIENLKNEADALKSFEGFGGVKILNFKEGAILLERAIPGQSLKSYFPAREFESIKIACDVIKELHKTPIYFGQSFPDVEKHLAALDNCNENIEQEYIDKARKIRNRLIKTSLRKILLHGDLHHDNILQAGLGWMAIDPVGIMGEPEYEIAAFIRNPIPELMRSSNAKLIINRRIYEFSNLLGFNILRIKDWCFVQGVLCMIWAIEDNADFAYFKDFIDVL